MEQTLFVRIPSWEVSGELEVALAAHLNLLRVPNLRAAFEACREGHAAAVVLPLEWPPPGGEPSLWAFLAAHAGQTPIFLYGRAVPAEVAHKALTAGASWVFHADAPHFVEEARRRVCHLLREAELRREEQLSREVLFAAEGLAGRSAAMHEVFRRAVKASQLSNLPVLITGPRGSPRLRLASAMHRFDPYRSGKPFFALDCSGLQAILLRKETNDEARVGTEALRRHWLGLMHAAEGGTLFLDRIEALDHDLQACLLELNRTASGSSGAQELAPAVRVIAASEDRLDEAVAGGAFHRELYEWLGLFQIKLPPLRGRPEDIAAQARHVIRQMQAGRECAVIDIAPGALEVLKRLPWEGNTRQLEATIREALARKRRGGLLERADLPDSVEAALHRMAFPGPIGGTASEPARPPCEEPCGPGSVAEDYERRLLEAVLRRHPAGRPRGWKTWPSGNDPH
jgi:DNA-binding NtrC family response regulator